MPEQQHGRRISYGRPGRATDNLNRRDLVKLASVSLAGAAMAGCDLLSTDPVEEGGADDADTNPDTREAPEFAALVRDGKLPAVEDRLPKQPMVVDVVDRMGVYGGEWRMAMIGGPSGSALNSSINYESLVRWHPDEFSVVPNVAESVTRDDDGGFTFVLREGLKWSDGEPFTADDIMFWYEGVFLNEELTPAKDTWMVTEGNPGVVEKVDDYTVIFRFDPPNGILLEEIATGWSGAGGPTSSPRHYLMDFHKEYNPESIDELVRKFNRDDWVDLFWDRSDDWANPDRPTLNAWKLTSGLGEDVGQVTAKRNPYYWKVDPDGRQLPYLDQVVHDVVESVETAVLNTQNGEHMLTSEINTLTNKPLFARAADQGNYRLIDTISGDMNEAIIFLNLTHKNPVKREMFQNKDFRIGLSHAIDREEVIAAAYQRQGEPWQAAPMREAAAYFNEELAKQYTEYDVTKSNDHLDRAGYSDRDDDGFRLGPDGNRISIQVDLAVGRRLEWVDFADLVKRYWADVGIEMRINSIGDSLFWTRMEANEFDAEIWKGDGGLNVMLAPYYYFPFSHLCKFAPAWGHWYKGDSRGEEPPAEVRKQLELYEQIKVTAEESERVRLMNEILEIAVDQFYCIGSVQVARGYQVVRNDFHNIPDPLPYDWYHAWLARTNTCQYFVAK